MIPPEARRLGLGMPWHLATETPSAVADQQGAT